MEDGAPAYNSLKSQNHKKNKKIKVFLPDKKNSSKLFWSGNFPLKLPRKYIASLKAGLYHLKNLPRTKQQLKNCLRRIWRNDEKNKLNLKLVSSLKKRMKELKKNYFEKISY